MRGGRASFLSRNLPIAPGQRSSWGFSTASKVKPRKMPPERTIIRARVTSLPLPFKQGTSEYFVAGKIRSLFRKIPSASWQDISAMFMPKGFKERRYSNELVVKVFKRLQRNKNVIYNPNGLK